MSNLYLISQEVDNDYDTFDSAVVVAENEEAAKKIHPRNRSSYFSYSIDDEGFFLEDGERVGKYMNSGWVQNITDVQVILIGVAVDALKNGTVVCSSFNAG